MSFESDYGMVFTPGAPVAARALLLGRDGELQKLRRYLERPGLHPIIIGDRGVGKTSLAIHALNSLNHVIVGCDPYNDFNVFAHSVLREARIEDQTTEHSIQNEREFQAEAELPLLAKGGATSRTTDSQKKQVISSLTVGPWEMYELLRDYPKRVVLVLDEYDLVPRENTEFHAKIARLVKHLADNHRKCDSRLVIIGIARTAQQLLGNHPSIQRSLREVFLRPLTQDDVCEFIEKGEKRLSFKFSPSVKQALIAESNGYPYFVHLVGLECLDVMIERNRRAREVTEEDYEQALSRAVQAAFRSELQKWSDAVTQMDKFEQSFIRELVAHHYPHPQRKEFERRILNNRVMTAPEFSHALLRLQQEKKMLYLSRGEDQIRFSDPLMRPFLRILFLPSPFSRSRPKYEDSTQGPLFKGDNQ